MSKKYKYVPVEKAIDSDIAFHTLKEVEVSNNEEYQSYFNTQEEAYKDLIRAKEKANKKYKKVKNLLNRIPDGINLSVFVNTDDNHPLMHFSIWNYFLTIHEQDYVFNYLLHF